MTTRSIMQSPGWTTWVKAHTRALLGISLEALTATTTTTLSATSEQFFFPPPPPCFCCRFIPPRKFKPITETPSFFLSSHRAQKNQTLALQKFVLLLCRLHPSARMLPRQEPPWFSYNSHRCQDAFNLLKWKDEAKK